MRHRILAPIPLLVLMVALFAAVHAAALDRPPNGYHKWREADTAQIAESYAKEDHDPLRPHILRRGYDSGVVGTELPAYTYAASLLYRALGFSHVWPRTLSLLAALIAMILMAHIARNLGFNERAQMLAALAFLWSPVIVFYGGKIQPDMMGLAAMLGGFLAFLHFTQYRKAWQGLLAALLLGIAAGIKPTLLGIGLPMLAIIVEREGWNGLRQQRYWLIAVAALAIPVLWLRYARSVQEATGSTYFYVGGDLSGELAGLASPVFYRQVLVSWPLEMGPAALALIAFALAGWRARSLPPLKIGMWILGGLITCCLSAQHCATPHDYYYLPLIPPLALMAGTLLDQAMNTRFRPVVWFLIVAFPIYGWQRIAGRYEDRPGFTELREKVATTIGPDARALTIDDTPGDLLYRVGLKGWQLPPNATLADVARQRYPYLVVTDKMLPRVQQLTPLFQHLVLHEAGVAVYALNTK